MTNGLRREAKALTTINQIMMKTNKLLLALSLLLSALLPASASGGIVITTRDGQKLKHSLADIRKITFEQNSLVVTSAAGTPLWERQSVSQIANIKFEATASAINLPTSTGSKPLGWQLNGRTLQLRGYDPSRGLPLQIFSATGQQLLNVPKLRSTAITLPVLPHGIYIIKIGNNNRIKLTL